MFLEANQIGDPSIEPSGKEKSLIHIIHRCFGNAVFLFGAGFIYKIKPIALNHI